MRLHHVICAVLAVTAISVACAGEASTENTTTDSAVSQGDAPVRAVAPAGCQEFQDLIDKTYDFKPTNLTQAQRTAKSTEMDAVWEKVKADKKTLPCLVSALESPTGNSFFRFDGSTLLFNVDQSEATKKLLIRSYARSELEDIALQDWIAYILRFGLEGLDTSEAGEAWLKAKDPHYYLPQHGTLKIDRQIGALAIFGSMDEKYATPSLAQIASQKAHPGREIAVSLLAKQVTTEAFLALTKLDRSGLTERSASTVTTVLTNPIFIEKRNGPPKISRDEYVKAFQEISEGRASFFMELVSRAPDGEKDAIAVLRPEDIPLVRRSRRFFASTGTPHAPEWYQSFTDILMVMVRKPEIDRQSAGEKK